MDLRREQVQLQDRARRALATGRYAEALQLTGTLLGVVNVDEAGLYERWLELALGAYHGLGRRHEAACVLMGLQRWGEARRQLDEREDALHWALCATQEGDHRGAAGAYAAANCHGLAALALRAAGDAAAACTEWQAALADRRLHGRKYETALYRFSLGEALLAQGAEDAAAREMAAAQRLLEELADEFESAGERERAFDCYGVMLQLGRDTGAFENVAEGYLNSIRILAADDRRVYVLQYYEDFIAYAAERGEWHAAATLAREAAAYSARTGLKHEGYYLGRAAELWLSAAERNREAGGPADLTESALHGGIEAASALGDLAGLARFYERLSELPLGDKREARYRHLAARYAALPAARPATVPFPEALRRPDAYQDVWRQDVVEWELQGDPAAVLAEVVATSKYSGGLRREALRALLLAVRPPPAEGPSPARLAELAMGLGRVGVYEVLRPLERLFEHTAPQVRAAVMNGVGRVFCFRSFALVRSGLGDGDESVRSEALRAMRSLKFRDGFEPLARIFRETEDRVVRTAALETLAEIRAPEAVLLLMDVLREDDQEVRALAEARLTALAGESAQAAIMRERLTIEVGPAREALARALAQGSA